MPNGNQFLDDLRWRNLLHQCTDEQALARHLNKPRCIYAGFDPTADSLTIGNLVPIMLLRHAQEQGHTPVVVMGGGTGRIGDPSGKEAERPLLTNEQIDANIASQRRIFERLLQLEGPGAAQVCNNNDWLGELRLIAALRDVGKHFSVNEMIRRDSVARRLEGREQGISYTEFSYMILQAYDFLHLFEHENVTVQTGGSDQWGNIASGVDLIRRVAQGEAFGLTAPLVTKADGGKFGKTESGAIWLTAERTSAYAFHQFWINTADADVVRFLKMFTLLSRSDIDDLAREHQANPGGRAAHRALADNATALMHGEAGAHRAQAVAAALFSGDVRSLDADSLRDAIASAPSSDHARSLLKGAGANLVELLPQTTLAKSKREAREFLAASAISVNGEKVASNRILTSDDLLQGETILLRRGKKHWHATRWI